MLQAYDSLFVLASRTKPKKLVLTPYTSRPRLSNGSAVSRLLSLEYPPALRATGRGGKATVAFLIRPDGKADHVRLLRSYGHEQLDKASTTVVHHMWFSPARNGSCPVPFFVAQSINYEVER